MADKIVESVVDQAAAPDEHVNPAEEARNDVRAAFEQLKAKAAQDVHPEAQAAAEGEPPATEAVTQEKSDDRPRGPDGKFLSKDKTEAAPQAAAPVEPKSPPVDNTAKASAPQPSTAASAPPVSWAADAKSAWAALPPAIQNAVLKRETEVSNGFKQKSEEVRRYETAISPIASEASRLGMSVDQGINALMSAHARIQSDPAGFIVDLAKQAGLDLATLASNPPAPQAPRFDPMVSQLSQKYSALESQFQNLIQSQTMGVIDSFAQGHPHYAAVESDIARLIPVIREAEPHLSPADTLQKAYDQAVWLNPEVRSQLIAEQQAEAEKSRLASIQTKAKQATKAAVSIKGSSNGAMPPPKTPSPDGSVYDDVRAAITQLRQ